MRVWANQSEQTGYSGGADFKASGAETERLRKKEYGALLLEHISNLKITLTCILLRRCTMGLSYITVAVLPQLGNITAQKRLILSVRVDFLYLHSTIPWSPQMCHSNWSDYLHNLEKPR